MSRHAVTGGDITGLFARFDDLRKKAQARTGKCYPLVVIQEAGLDGFWIDRVLRQEDWIESHVVDAASIAVSRRRRVPAPSSRHAALRACRPSSVRTSVSPSIRSVFARPTPEDEDRRRISRERKTLIAERIEHSNRIKGLLFSQGIRDYEPLRRDRRKRLDELRTGDGRALPVRIKGSMRNCGAVTLRPTKRALSVARFRPVQRASATNRPTVPHALRKRRNQYP